MNLFFFSIYIYILKYWSAKTITFFGLEIRSASIGSSAQKTPFAKDDLSSMGFSFPDYYLNRYIIKKGYPCQN